MMRSFMKDAEGRELFFRGGPFSRPWLIEDAATGERLVRKRTRMIWLWLLVALLVSIRFPGSLAHRPPVFFAVLGVLLIGGWVAERIAYFGEFRALPRAPRRFYPRCYFEGLARQHTEGGLFALMLLSLGCTALILIMLLSGTYAVSVSLTCLAFCVVAAASWGYALRLKMGQRQ